MLLAQLMAKECELVSAEAVEATEFPELSARFEVSGVPHTVINDGMGEFVGAVPESVMVENIKNSIRQNK